MPGARTVTLWEVLTIVVTSTQCLEEECLEEVCEKHAVHKHIYIYIISEVAGKPWQWLAGLAHSSSLQPS